MSMSCVVTGCLNKTHQGGGRRMLMLPDDGLSPTQLWICEPCYKDMRLGKFKYKNIRGEITAFAEVMERQLQENEHKGGWQSCSAEFLLSEATNHLNALKRVIKAKKMKASEKDLRIRDDAPDVANFVMMLHNLWVVDQLYDEDGDHI